MERNADGTYKKTWYTFGSDAAPHVLVGQFLLELGVLVGITAGALWALGWRREAT